MIKIPLDHDVERYVEHGICYALHELIPYVDFSNGSPGMYFYVNLDGVVEYYSLETGCEHRVGKALCIIYDLGFVPSKVIKSIGCLSSDPWEYCYVNCYDSEIESLIALAL